MNTWAVQDAKARFSELLEQCVANGPQVVTKRGAETAVLVPIAEWQRLNAAAPQTLKSLLLSDVARTETLAPKRAPLRHRAPIQFD
jgi:antitoxin Phd